MNAKVTLHLGFDSDVFSRALTLESLSDEATLGDLTDLLHQQNPQIFDRPLQRILPPVGTVEAQAVKHVKGLSITVDELSHPEGLRTLGNETVPLADGFDYPVAKPNAAGYYDASGMAGQAYRAEFGFWHTGEDWNKRTGGDSDLGEPVYAIANGRVTNVGYYTPAWGNIILIEHLLPGNEKVWSQYAHLRDVYVQPGTIVYRGQTIGTIGKGANNTWAAHLHFEIRKANLPPQQWGYVTDEDRQRLLRDYHYPSQFINAHRVGYLDGIVVSEDSSQFVRSPSQHWYRGTWGHQRRNYWTWTVRDCKDEECVAIWSPVINELGRYELFAHIPSDNATTLNARYEITHADGISRVTVVQNDYYDQWVSLGAYKFGPGRPATVRLSDVTG